MIFVIFSFIQYIYITPLLLNIIFIWLRFLHSTISLVWPISQLEPGRHYSVLLSLMAVVMDVRCVRRWGLLRWASQLQCPSTGLRSSKLSGGQFTMSTASKTDRFLSLSLSPVSLSLSLTFCIDRPWPWAVGQSHQSSPGYQQPYCEARLLSFFQTL